MLRGDQQGAVVDRSVPGIVEQARQEALGQTVELARSFQVTADAAARLPRQSIELTRADMLEAGRQLVCAYLDGADEWGSTVVDPVSFLRLSDVLDVASELARRRLELDGRIRPDERIAPLTAGAFYKAFEGGAGQGDGRGAVLTDFRRTVVRHLVTDPILANAAIYTKLGLEMHAAGESWIEVVRVCAEIEFQRWVRSPVLKLVSALGAYVSDGGIRDWLGLFDTQQRKHLVDLHSRLLEAYNRQMKYGLSVDQIATAVSDCISGMAISSRHRHRAQATVEADIGGGGVREWSLCALAVWSIYDSLTEPAFK